MKGWKLFFVWSMGLFLPASVWAETSMRTDTIPASIIEIPENTPKQPPHEHIVNFGVKGGFTASLFLVSDFSINGQEIKEVQNNYKIGYFASVFMRINFERHFIQPEISYSVNRCNILFDKPQAEGAPEDTPLEQASITSSIHSIDIPVIYGYNIIKDGPYSLAVFGGPKIRYILDRKNDITFENFNLDNMKEELYPFNLNLTLGVAITISRVFFDFRYDIGLHNISKKITYTSPELTPSPGEEIPDNEIRFHRRDNVLSFSLGMFF